MTLIARPLRSICPIIFSDILITDTIVEQPLILPTMGFDISSYLPTKNNRFPVGLSQKSYILRENICIAFSGMVYEIQKLLEELVLFLKIHEPKIGEKEIRNFFDEHYDVKGSFGKSSCLLILVEKEDDGTIISKEFTVGNWRNDSNELFLETQASGSGSSDYLYQAREKVEFTSSFENSSVNEGIVKNLSFLAKMLAVERASLYPIKNHWGAGYELIVYDGKSFIKFDEIAYIINEGDFTEYGDIRLPFPTVVMYYKYVDDVLFITSINLKNHHLVIEDDYLIMTSSDVSVRVHPVKPFLKDPNKADATLENVAFETNRVALGYSIKTPDLSMFNPSLTTYSRDLKVRYVPGEGVQIMMKIGINEMVREKSQQVFVKNWLKK